MPKWCLEEGQCGRRRVHIFPFLTGCGLKLTWPAVRSNSEGKKTVIRFTMDSLIAANTKFCFDLFQKISTDDCRKNIFFCPLSLSAALGMVRLGARSGSARQIDQVLHFNEFSQNKGSEPDPCLKKAEQEGPADSNLEGQKEVAGSLTLQTESSKDESGLLSCYFGQLLSKLARIKVDYTLSIANRLYGEREFPICPEYLDGVIQFYHTTVESVDFRKDTEKSRQEINFWVESQSQGKIKELFSKDSINNETVLVLVNAVYFKAKWEKYFDCENTVDAVFSLSESEKKNVKMMNQNGLFRIGFVEELKAQILELPYTKGKLDMVVLLPSGSADNRKALEELERNITYEKLVAWSSSENMSEKRVAVSFPRFTLEDSYDLNPILQDMGVTDIFDETKADLTGISPSPSLYLSKVVHKTFVEVDENGTQAVAASGVVGMEKSSPSWETFNANRPFLFFIRHNKTQTVLFYGRVCSP
ncbi:serpin B12 [Oryx dammah]|uniref:serpin B12 n=1 Tax=Oryx dammah TaxID=59534 RepID=UPI001A9B1A8A|nr:serpin B12 [Oryx dammah]